MRVRFIGVRTTYGTWAGSRGAFEQNLRPTKGKRCVVCWLRFLLVLLAHTRRGALPVSDHSVSSSIKVYLEHIKLCLQISA